MILHAIKTLMPNLDSSEWRVLCFLMARSQETDSTTIEASYAEINKGSGIRSNITTSRAIKTLVEVGAIEFESGQGQGVKSVYTLKI